MVEHTQINQEIYHINKLKNKGRIIISTDTEKIFEKIQYPFIIKSLSKWIQVEHSSTQSRQHMRNLQPASHCMGKSRKHFPKIQKHTRMPTLTTAVQYNHESFSQSPQSRK